MAHRARTFEPLPSLSARPTQEHQAATHVRLSTLDPGLRDSFWDAHRSSIRRARFLQKKDERKELNHAPKSGSRRLFHARLFVGLLRPAAFARGERVVLAATGLDLPNDAL